MFCSDECKKARIKQRYEMNKDDIKAYHQKYYAEHREEIISRQKANHPNYERDRWRKIRGSKEYTKQCVVCGKTFATWNPNKKTCSDECKRCNKNRRRGKRTPEQEHARWVIRQYGSEEAYQQHLAEKEKKIQEQMKQTRLRKEQERAERLAKNHRIGTCVVCGKTFETYNPMQKTCCKQCGRKLANARKQKRIPEKQIIDKDITLEALYRRDSGVCYLCGGKCDWNDKDVERNIVGRMYPSIDHIVPVSRGGLHSWDNVRLAHFGCNVNKSDEILPNTEELIPINAYKFKHIVPPRKKKTLQYSKDNILIAEYESTAEAERQTGFKQRGIQKCATGVMKTYKGYIWKYA